MCAADVTGQEVTVSSGECVRTSLLGETVKSCITVTVTDMLSCEVYIVNQHLLTGVLLLLLFSLSVVCLSHLRPRGAAIIFSAREK